MLEDDFLLYTVLTITCLVEAELNLTDSIVKFSSKLQLRVKFRLYLLKL